MPQINSPRDRLQATLRDYLQIIFRRKWFFFLPLCIIFFLVTLSSFFLPKIYRATATIMIEEPPVINPLERAGRAQPRPQLTTIKERMLSWPRLLELIRSLKLDAGITSQRQLQELLSKIGEQFSIRMRAANVFELSFEDRDPVKAQDAVNSMAQIFIEATLTAQRGKAITAVDFISKQVDRYRTKLEDSDRALYKFKEKNLMIFPGMEQNTNLQKFVQYQSQLVETNLDYAKAKRELDLLKKQLSGKERIIFTENTRGLNPLLDELNAQIVKAELELTNLLVDATEKHPRVIELRAQIARMKKRLAKAAEETVNSETSSQDPVYLRLQQRYREQEINFRNLTARRTELEKLIAKFRKRADEVPEAERKLANLTRNNMVNQKTYAMLLQRLESSRISQVEVKERGTRYQIIAPAQLPLKPSKPQKGRMAAMGFMVGLLISLGIVFLVEVSDHSLHGVEDAKAFLTFPVLAAVPTIFTPADLTARESERRFAWLLIAGFSLAFLLSFIIELIIVSS